MHPILFRIGDYVIHTYSVVMNLGILVSLALAYMLWRERGEKRERTEESHSPSRFLDTATVVLLAGIVGGRVAFIFSNWTHFSSNPAEILALWAGGMSFQGAFIAGSVGLLIWTRFSRHSFWAAADIFSVALACGCVFGWLACFAAGCAYGVTGQGALFFVSPDIYGIEAPRFASQPTGAAQSSVILLILFVGLRRSWPQGQAFAVFLLLYFGGQFALEFMRGDQTIRLGMWRLTQVIDALLAGVGIVGLLTLRRERSTPANLPPTTPESTLS